MDPKQFIDQIQNQITQLLQTTPAKDLEKNVRALLTQGLAKLDMVPREEFEAQALQLARIRERLDVLEKRVAELETALSSAPVHRQS